MMVYVLVYHLTYTVFLLPRTDDLIVYA